MTPLRKTLGSILLILAIIIMFFFVFELVFRHKMFRHIIASGLYNVRRYTEAENIWGKALDPEDGDHIPESSMGNIRYKRNDFPDAQKSFAAAIAEKDSLRNLLYNLGNAQYRNELLDEALESYKSAMLLDPLDQDAKMNYELVLMRKGYKPPPQPSEEQERKEREEEQKKKDSPQQQQDDNDNQDQQKPQPENKDNKTEDAKEQYDRILDALDQTPPPQVKKAPQRGGDGGKWW